MGMVNWNRDTWSYNVYATSSLLFERQLIERAGRNIIRLISAMTPGEMTQANNQSVEVALRIEKFCENILLIPMSVVALPFFSLSRIVSNALSTNNMHYLKGKPSEKTEGDDVKISQHNICAGGFASYFAGGVEDSKKRIDSIINSHLQDDADVIIFEEVYDQYAVKRIYDRLKDHYAHFYVNMGITPPDEKDNLLRKINPFNPTYKASGLLVVSKRKIEDAQFHSFGGPQDTVNKGFFAGNIITENGKIPFAGTHLNASEEDAYQLADSEEELDIMIERYLPEDQKATEDDTEANKGIISREITKEMEVRQKQTLDITEVLESIRNPDDHAYIFADFNVQKNGMEAQKIFEDNGLIYANDDDQPTNYKEKLTEDGIWLWNHKKREPSNEEEKKNLKDENKPNVYNFDYALCLPAVGFDSQKDKLPVKDYHKQPIPQDKPYKAQSDHSKIVRTITARS